MKTTLCNSVFSITPITVLKDAEAEGWLTLDGDVIKIGSRVLADFYREALAYWGVGAASEPYVRIQLEIID